MALLNTMLNHYSPLLLGFGLLFSLTAEAATKRELPGTRLPEPVMTISLTQPPARQCSANPASQELASPHASFRGDALYGVLLAAHESGIEVETIATDPCAPDLNL